MSEPATTPSTGATVPACDLRLPAAEIDASLRWPMLLLFGSATAWLLLGSLLSLVTYVKFVQPGFLGDISWLTLGRVRPAATNAFLYGFASQAALGTMLWMLCRQGGNRFFHAVPVMIATKVWNLGVTVGVVAIFAGGSTGFEWLEMPRYAAGFLFVGYVVIGLCALGTFQLRRHCELYPSQWFLLAALFWFPWIYSAANYLLVLDPVRGTLQATVNAWFTGNLSGLWLAPLALAGIYYFIPRLTGKVLYSRELASFAFWTFVFFSSFSGLTGLIGAPVPRWMPALSTIANVCLLLPLACNVVNWRLTTRGNCEALKTDVILRFIALGGFCYVVVSLLKAVLAFPELAVHTNLTVMNVAVQALTLHGFVGSVLFGCAYYLLPRVARVEWAQEKLINVHFLCTAIGVALMAIGFGAAGVSQAVKFANGAVPFMDAVRSPFLFLGELGFVVLFIGQCAFAVNLGKLICRVFEPVRKSFCAQWCGGAAGNTASAEVKP
jgi:cytochrome c oxidase cbb3-type subunit 1